MEPVVAIAGMLLIVALVLAVGYPFFSRPPVHRSVIGVRSQELQERKEQLYASLKELEFDRDLGKVSAADYERLRQPLEDEALRIIEEIDEINGHSHSPALRPQLEAEVQARRQVAPSEAGLRCPACQAERRREDRFCAHCGAPLEDRRA